MLNYVEWNDQEYSQRITFGINQIQWNEKKSPKKYRFNNGLENDSKSNWKSKWGRNFQKN